MINSTQIRKYISNRKNELVNTLDAIELITKMILNCGDIE